MPGPLEIITFEMRIKMCYSVTVLERRNSNQEVHVMCNFNFDCYDCNSVWGLLCRLFGIGCGC